MSEARLQISKDVIRTQMNLLFAEFKLLNTVLELDETKTSKALLNAISENVLIEAIDLRDKIYQDFVVEKESHE